VTLLVATGLSREARILQGPGLAIVAGGGRSEALEAMLAAKAGEARAILSIGLGGALAPGLKPGDWVAAEAVLADGETIETHPEWTAALARALPGAQAGAILGSDAMLTEAAEKQAAHARTGALAVDMESHVAARVAQRFGLPFAAARVVSDAAARSLPAAVKVGMRPDGGMALGAVLLALARAPLQTPALIRTGLEAGQAFRGLVDARRLLGPRLGLPDFVELPLDMR
jgi:hopanoid-associated phosphorylase